MGDFVVFPSSGSAYNFPSGSESVAFDTHDGTTQVGNLPNGATIGVVFMTCPVSSSQSNPEICSLIPFLTSLPCTFS